MTREARVKSFVRWYEYMSLGAPGKIGRPVREDTGVFREDTIVASPTKSMTSTDRYVSIGLSAMGFDPGFLLAWFRDNPAHPNAPFHDGPRRKSRNIADTEITRTGRMIRYQRRSTMNTTGTLMLAAMSVLALGVETAMAQNLTGNGYVAAGQANAAQPRTQSAPVQSGSSDEVQSGWHLGLFHATLDRGGVAPDGEDGGAS
jgi:hypothetical protein